jgi:antitoxin (DNA-binding transcriptional repressor) of toxin-antitoxin stability system
MANMTVISASEIERDPAGCLRRVEGGETLVVMRENRAVAEIKPVASQPQGPRPFGLAAGEFVIPDDFDAPLPDEVLDLFEGR